MGVSEAAFYNWKAKYGGLEVSEGRHQQNFQLRLPSSTCSESQYSRIAAAVATLSEFAIPSVGIATAASASLPSAPGVPLPAVVLPCLPKTIKGPLFENGDARVASKRLNRFLRDSGVTVPGKVVQFAAPSSRQAPGCGRAGRYSARIAWA